ncbi:acetyltransferase [Kushneria aurantia]|uniref:Acetyltransferase n=1 Tax=Kushneria aurantia TaxID=504092 RepID=A0ABV6G4U7_9GAMM|nr:acetyltransferase [Kushneria aurantia]
MPQATSQGRWVALLKGTVSVILLVTNTLLWGVPLLLLSLLRPVLPFNSARRRLRTALDAVAGGWIAGNNWWIRHWLAPDWRVTLPNGLCREQHWLVIANHRSWVDVFILMSALHQRLPPPRFFVKRELSWIPIVGQAFRALDFPIMRRYSRAQLKRRPQLARRDLQTTRRALADAGASPVTLYNFAEGTRFSIDKQRAQRSPWQHLLKPRAGGCAQVVELLGEHLCGIVDITLDYRAGRTGFGDFLCGRGGSVTIRARRLEIPPWMAQGDYAGDPLYRQRFQNWINVLWQEKDQQLSCSDPL